MTPFEHQLLEYLLNYVTPERHTRFIDVLSTRTRRLTVVLEDVYGSHNIAAVLRSCDAFGIQDVHVIEDSHDFQLEPVVSLGSQKWLTVHRYRDCPDPRGECIAALRRTGYRLLALSPHADAQPPEEVDLHEPCALLFGTERDGLTSRLMDAADAAIRIPMTGFVESLNISVAAAVCLYPMLQRLRDEFDDWRLSRAEKRSLLLDWVRQSIPHAEALEAHFAQQCTIGAGSLFTPPPDAAGH